MKNGAGSPTPAVYARLWIGSIYVLLAFLMRLHWPGWDWSIFINAADKALSGDGFRLYSDIYELIVFQNTTEVPANIRHAYVYPPLIAFLLAPFRAWSHLAGYSEQYQRFFCAIPLIAGDLFSAHLLTRVIRTYRKMTDWEATGFFAIFLCSWIVFYSTVYHGHFETVLLAFLLSSLLCLRRGHLVWGGVWLGLALLTKQTALLAWIGVAWTAHRSGGRFWFRVPGLALLIFTAGMGPFILADPRGTRVLLWTLSNQWSYSYQSCWLLFQAFPSTHSALQVISPYVNTFILAVVTGYGAWAARKEGVDLLDGRLPALLAGIYVLTALFSKQGALHYYLLPFAFLLLWEGTMNRIPWVSVAFTAFLSHIFMMRYSYEVFYRFGPTTALVMVVLFSSVMVVLTLSLSKRRIPRPEDSGLFPDETI